MKKNYVYSGIVGILALCLSFHSVAATTSQPALLKQYREKLNQEAFEPFVEVTETGLRASAFLKQIQEPLLRLNDLSYNRVKAGDAYLRFADTAQTRLQDEGWEMKSFTGLEGKRSQFIDVSGIVAYNAMKNVIAVVYHGTAGNDEGWQTNFDAVKLDPRELLMELGRDLHADLLEKLDAASYNSGARMVRSKMKAITPHGFTSQRMQEVLDKIESLTEGGVIDSEINQYLTAPIRLKLEVVEYIEKTGTNVDGMLHRGFAKKYYSTKKNVIDALKYFIERLPQDKREGVKVVFSGHSQAGATANLALADIVANHTDELFGTKVENKGSGTFYGYFLSAARVGDRDYARFAHKNVGVSYIVRQNVWGDPVPVASGDAEMAATLRNAIPAIGALLAETAGFDDTGHLLLDDSNDAWERARALYVEANLDVDAMESFTGSLYNALSMLMNPESIPEFIAPRGDGPTWNPVRKVVNAVNVVGLANRTYAALKGDERAVAELSTLATQRYAHLHYGHFRNEIKTAAFDIRVVGLDIDGMLARGEAHESEKYVRRKEERRLSKQKSRLKLMQDLYPKTLPAATVVGF